MGIPKRPAVASVKRRAADTFAAIPRLGCGLQIRPGDRWTCDHVEAIISGGANREVNPPPLCEWCEPPKTKADVSEKSRKLKPKGRPVIGTVASGWRRHVDGAWERRA